jgi:hypothetical protein
VLASPATAPPLDGGIALKPRQRLVGDGPAVVGLARSQAAPRLTNTDAAQQSGDAVVLADHAIVRNLVIVAPVRGAIYGRDVTHTRVLDNDVSGHNSSCAPGFLIPAFIAPTSVPGVGVPIADGLLNGFAAITLDASQRRGRITISGNRVHDAHCGDGIDIRLSGTASYRARIEHNDVSRLEQGAPFASLLAIGMQTREHAQLAALVDGNRQSELGNAGDPNVLTAGADSEGVFVNAVGPSRIDVAISHNDYTNARGLGGFSANGLELVTMGDGSDAHVSVRDSSFSGSPGDVIEEGALGTNAHLDLRLDRVVATRSTGIGNTVLFPFNNGDCLLAGSLGAANTIRLAVHDSALTGCANNGLSIGSNVTNGSGPTTAIDVDVSGSEITGNRGGNLAIRNFTALGRLTVKVQDSDLRDSQGAGSGLADVSAEDLGTTAHSVIDLGGGALGSRGANCISGGSLDVDAVRYDVHAQGNWWGRPGAPAPGRTLAVGASIDATHPLAAATARC